MKKTKKIFATIGIVLLVLLYLSTLFFAFFDTTASLFYLKCSIAATIFFPVILYVMTMFHKLNNKNQDLDKE